MSGESPKRLDHHPDWQNVYNRVKIELHTHDAGGITELDFQLAARMLELEGRHRRTLGHMAGGHNGRRRPRLFLIQGRPRVGDVFQLLRHF